MGKDLSTLDPIQQLSPFSSPNYLPRLSFHWNPSADCSATAGERMAAVAPGERGLRASAQASGCVQVGAGGGAQAGASGRGRPPLRGHTLAPGTAAQARAAPASARVALLC